MNECTMMITIIKRTLTETYKGNNIGNCSYSDNVNVVR